MSLVIGLGVLCFIFLTVLLYCALIVSSDAEDFEEKLREKNESYNRER